MATSLKWKQLLSAIVLISSASYSSIPDKLKYKTIFNTCPSQSAGKFAMKILKSFEEKQSLYSVKSDINSNFLKEKHFIDTYNIKFDPNENELNIVVNCPTPLMKVMLMDKEANGEYQSILVENGDLYDPTYEVLLSNEKKLKNALPSLVINKSDMNIENRKLITSIIKELGSENFSKVGEIVFDNNQLMTMILSLRKKPVSVFMGKDNLIEKTGKLSRLLKYADENNKQPTVINLINSKKVVVKFAHKK